MTARPQHIDGLLLSFYECSNSTQKSRRCSAVREGKLRQKSNNVGLPILDGPNASCRDDHLVGHSFFRSMPGEFILSSSQRNKLAPSNVKTQAVKEVTGVVGSGHNIFYHQTQTQIMGRTVREGDRVRGSVLQYRLHSPINSRHYTGSVKSLFSKFVQRDSQLLEFFNSEISNSLCFSRGHCDESEEGLMHVYLLSNGNPAHNQT